MKPIGWIIAIIFVAGLAVAGCIAVVNDEDSMARLPVILASHDYDERGDGSDGNRGYDGEGGRSGDMEQGDGRNCRNFCDNVIYIPDPRGGDEEQPR